MTYDYLNKAQLDKLLSGTSPNSFKFNIAKMHDIYKLPKNEEPTLDPTLLGDEVISRLTKFQATLQDELDEVVDIRNKIKTTAEALTTKAVSEEELAEWRKDILTDIADWLSDLTVYIRSEAMKFGIPLEDTLDAVMGSNFSKVGDNPKYDSNGKVLKDLSLFIPPESAIKTIMFGVANETPVITPKFRHPYEAIGDEE